MRDKVHIEKILELWKERNEKEFSWVKQCLSVVAIILGLILTLKTDIPKDLIAYLLFTIAIVSNGLCIISGLIFLYSETDTIHSLVLKYQEHLATKSDNENQQLIQVRPKRIYSILRIAFFISLSFGIISLIAYAIYTNYPC
jgi:hypothetical protein